MEHQFCPYCMNPVEGGKPCEACGLTQGSYSPSPHHLPPGTVLKERYLVGRVLGEGGFGITYIGCDLQLELKVAIKEYFPTDKASRVSQASLDVTSYTGAAGLNYDKGLKKFLQEARTIARMDKQPVIVNVRDFFEANCTAYIVMEYVEGTTFKDLVEQRGGRIPAGELLYLIEPLFYALKEMHGNGLIHRDISPENLMLEKGTVRLLDFGCARESADGGNTLTIALKHGYAPVEQYQSKGQGPWTDVYALSATMYYCLTGKRPPQAMDRLVEDDLIPPRKLGVDLTQQQEAALLHGMSVPPKRRFQSVEEFHTALYEGFLPAPLEEPASDARPSPDGEDAAAGGEKAAVGRTVDAAQMVGAAEQPDFHLAAWLKQNSLLAGGIAAALALVVLLAAVLPRVLGPGQAEDPDATQTVESQPGAEPTATTPTVESMDASSVRSLLNQLEDDAVGSVVVPSGVWLEVKQPVTLTKPLRVRGDGGVFFHSGITVAQGGRLEVEGTVGGDVLLRTLNGGTVSVGAGGHLDSGMFWLEREGDLTCDPEGEINLWDRLDPTKAEITDPWAQSHYLVLEEEELFADAVHITSEGEFIQYCQGDRPIVIDGEITLTHFREASVPIRISEGAAFSAPIDGNDCTLDIVRGGLMLNYGTVRGRISLMGDYEDPAGVCRFLNFGQAEVCLNSFGGPSTMLNQGDFTYSAGFTEEPMLEGGCLSNLGQVTFGPGVSVTQQGNWSHNGGTITLSGGSYTLKEGTGFINWGAITLENGARLVVDTDDLHDQGTLTVSADSAVEGSGKIKHSFDDPGDETGSVRIAGQEVPLDTTQLDLTEKNIGDLSPLSRLTNLENLYLRGNPVSDLSPLAGLTSLRTLDLFATQASDLTPLEGLTGLTTLFLDNTRVTDVSPLAGMTELTQLHLDDTQVSDISPLGGMAKLTELTLCGCPVEDISALRDMHSLKDLRLNGTRVTDLTPLYGLRLDMLMVDRGQFTQQQLDELTATQLSNFLLKYPE